MISSSCTGSRAGHVSGGGRVSQVPEQPSRPCALFLDPGRTEHARPLRRADAAPACVYNGGSHDEYFGARYMALGLAVCP